LPSPPNEEREVDDGRTIGEINEILGGWVRTYYQVGPRDSTKTALHRVGTIEV